MLIVVHVASVTFLYLNVYVAPIAGIHDTRAVLAVRFETAILLGGAAEHGCKAITFNVKST